MAKIHFLCSMKWFGKMRTSLEIQWLLLWTIAMVSMIFSKEFLLSQAMIFMVATAVFRMEKGHLRFRESFLNLPSILRREPVWWILMLPFFIVLFSGFYTEDYSYWLERLRIKLPLLFLPLAFAALPSLSWYYRKLGLYVFLWVLLVACLYVIGVVWSNYEEVYAALSRGQAMPTPSNHIRFSIATSFAVFVSLYLARSGFFVFHRFEVKLLWGLAIFFFLFLHFLAVRSGLLSLYVALFFLAFRQIFSPKTPVYLRRWSLFIVFVAVLLPFLSYRWVPAFQRKIDYMRWDLQQYFSGNMDYSSSDSDRLRSLEVGWEIGRSAPFLGVGAGDLALEVGRRYERRYAGKVQPKMPHSQWLTYFAGTGILGLGVFLFSFFYPLFEKRRYLHFLFLAFYIILFVSLFVENTFENNFGLSFYVLFVLWLLPISDCDEQKLSLGKAEPGVV